MKLKNIVIGIFMLMLMYGQTLLAQDLSWVSNALFQEQGNHLTNSLPQGTTSSLLTSQVLASSSTTGYIVLSGLQKDGTVLSGDNIDGSLTLGLTTGNTAGSTNYSIRLSRFTIIEENLNGRSSSSSKAPEPTVSIYVYDAQGSVIGSLTNTTLNGLSTLSIRKTGPATLQFRFGDTVMTTVNNADAPFYRAVIATDMAGLSFDYNVDNFNTTADSHVVPVVLDLDWNWTFAKTYDASGKLTSSAVNYYDELARSVQVQRKDILTGRNWASETRYDKEGRTVLTTLEAPVSNTLDFSHKEGFMTTFTEAPNVFQNVHFEGLENPGVVGEHPGTLGWYYSNQNNDEPFQDFTRRPYSLLLYDELNPGEVRAMITGNSVDVNGNGTNDGLLDTYPQGYSHTMQAAQELYYAFGKNYFPENRSGWFAANAVTPFSVSNTMLTHRARKVVTIDAHGHENIAFIDLEGRALAVARSGGPHEYPVISTIGEQGFVDVHLPKGTTNSDISFLGGTAGYTVWDLRSGEQLSNTSTMTGGNIYRIAYTDPVDTEKTIVTLNSSGNLLTQPGAKGLSYQVNYYDYTLNHYDESGNLVADVQPLGFDDACITGGLNAIPEHQMLGSSTFNSYGQLIASSHTDEGAASVVYREDGQVLFSQNNVQAASGEFSYTQYDEYSRPVESGISQGGFPGLPPGSQTLGLVANTPIFVEMTSNSVTKTGGIAPPGVNRWAEGGFYSTNEIVGDFRLSFKPEGNYTMLGLSQIEYESGDYRKIDYNLFRTTSSVQVRENNSQKTGYIGGAGNSILAIQRVGSTITYWKDDQLLYTNDNATTAPLHLDGNINTTGSEIHSISIEYLNIPMAEDFEVIPSNCRERTLSLYDVPDQQGLEAALATWDNSRRIEQTWLSGNVSKTWNISPHTNTTWYSYDVYGRVSWMVQQIEGLGVKVISYVYDEFTGNVSFVKYRGNGEQFIHRYAYNDASQLVKVSTSYDNGNFKDQVSYEYYETGALKRTVIADGLQGIDYVYNLNG
ncbi:MAG: hypothetical protein AAFO69_06095, partial [Bacteroidota bacterium]